MTVEGSKLRQDKLDDAVQALSSGYLNHQKPLDAEAFASVAVDKTDMLDKDGIRYIIEGVRDFVGNLDFPDVDAIVSLVLVKRAVLK